MDDMVPAFPPKTPFMPEYNAEEAAMAAYVVSKARERLTELEAEREHRKQSAPMRGQNVAPVAPVALSHGAFSENCIPKNESAPMSGQNVAPVAPVALSHGAFSEKPLPLRQATQKQSPYPTADFGTLAQAVQTLAEAVKVPEAMAGASVLTTLAFCTQGMANVLMRDGRTIPLSLYCLTVGDSGDRKTALDSVVSQSVNAIERELYKDFQIEMKAFEEARDAYERRSKKEKELFAFEQEEPKNPAMVLENINAEGLYRTLKEGRPSLAVFSDEGGTLFGGNAFQKENVLKSITFFSKLWDGSAVDKVRSGEGFSRLYDRRVSMHLMVQPTIAETILHDELFQGQGFLPRFLVSWPTSLKGSRYYNDRNARNTDAMQYFYGICDKLLRTPLPQDNVTGNIIFDTLSLSDDAHSVWVAHHDQIEKLLAPEGPLNIIYAVASKNAEQAIRIAGILTLSEEQGSRIITGETMAHAIKIAQWYIKESLRLRQESVVPTPIRKAESLLEWIQNTEMEDISVRYIMRNGPKALRTKKDTEAAIKVLEEHGYVRKGVGSAMIDGTTSKNFWKVSPWVTMPQS